MPYPNVGPPPLKLPATRSTSAGGAGAPPPPMPRRLEVSNSVNLGELTRSQLWVGTPTKLGTRSRSINSSAFSAFHRYIITSFARDTTQLINTGTDPVTWNNGTIKMNVVRPLGGVAPDASARTASTVARLPNAITDETTAPLVDTAPFGRPVVPDVYRIVASSSQPTSTMGIERPGTTTSSHCSTSASDGALARTSIMRMPSRRHGFIARAMRSSSAINSKAPQSSRAYSISSSTQNAFSDTETPPIDTMASIDMTHSG